MKKWLFFVVVFMIVSAGFVVADEGLDDSTSLEVEAMSTTVGAEMRMLQLEYQIERRVLWAGEVVSYLAEKGEDTSELEGIVAELELLSDEVSETSVDDLEIAIDGFIRIKSDALLLIEEFRELASGLLDDDDRAELRLRFEELDRTELNMLRERIVEKRREVNAERFREMSGPLGVDDEEYALRIREGEVNAEEISQRLNDHYEGANMAVRERIENSIREEISQRKAVAEERAGEYLRTRAEVTVQRTQERAEVLGKMVNEFAVRRANRIVQNE